jgi:tRNA modification GTPase
VALAGLPNAGKSSLLNYLAGYEAAIVTDIEGTTRDVLREHISLKGIPLRVYDTAGLRDTENPVEKEGVRRAWNVIEQADVVLYLVDSSRDMSDADRKIIATLPRDRLQLVYSKSDLVAAPTDQAGAIAVSVRDGAGTERLIERITGHTNDLNQDNQTFMARRRHVEALKRAAQSLDQAAATFAASRSGELMAEDLRDAQRQLNEITGDFTSDDLLGRIFASFCIGK